MEGSYTLREVATITGLHKNTISNYVKRGVLKAELVGEGTGKQKWVIRADDLYHCGVPAILAHLGPQEVEARLAQAEAGKTTSSDEALSEIIRLSRELLVAREELAALRVQIPMLQAAQNELELTRGALEEARSNARWRWKRKMAKSSK